MDEVFVSSPYVAEDLRISGFKAKVSYLPLASDLDNSTRKTTLISRANKEFDLKSVNNVLVSLGNVRQTKRLDFAIKAMKIVKDRGVKFRYYIIGPGEEIPNLRKLISRLSLDDDIILLGQTEDDKMASLIARADVMLYPSVYDYYGIAKIECAGFGVPGIFIKDSFVANEVFDEVNGYVSEDNIQEYADTITKVLFNRAQLKEVSANAYNDLYLTWEQCADKLVDRIKGIIQEKNKLSVRLKKERSI